MRKNLFLCVILILLCAERNAMAQERYAMPFTIMEYNCENLFDCADDSLKDDSEFLPQAERRWTFGRYWKKLNDIGRVIHQCGGKGKAWRLPDVVALVEVENDSAMVMLSRCSMLRNAGYRYVMTNSPDLRGIDVALMYNPLTFRLLSHNALRITPIKGQRPTRDVLYAKGMVRSGDTIHVFAVHAPSRSGGQTHTEGYRMEVARRVNAAVDSIRQQSPDAAIVVAGDFNDYSFDKPLKAYCANNLVEISRNAVGKGNPKKVTGTYKYQGEWESLDHILLSPVLAERAKACFIMDNGWLLEKDSQGSYKPFRTYLGPHYHGGVSDHLPLVLRMEF